MTTRYFAAFAKNPDTFSGGPIPEEIDPRELNWLLTELFIPEEEYPIPVNDGIRGGVVWFPGETRTIRFSSHSNPALMVAAQTRAMPDYYGFFAYLSAFRHAGGWEISEREDMSGLEIWIEQESDAENPQIIPEATLTPTGIWPSIGASAFCWKVIFSVEDTEGRWGNPKMVGSRGTDVERRGRRTTFPRFDDFWEDSKTQLVSFAKNHAHLREEWKNVENCALCSYEGTRTEEENRLHVLFLSIRRSEEDTALHYHPFPICSEHSLDYNSWAVIRSCWACGVGAELVFDSNTTWTSRNLANVSPRWAAGDPGGGLMFAENESSYFCELCAGEYEVCSRGQHFTHVDDHDCSACAEDDTYEEENNNNWVKNWDYRPNFIYHPPLPTRKDGLYLGMEVEVSFSGYDQWHRVASYVTQEMPELWYVKGDSSVDNGYEWVTHPFEPGWLFENWEDHVENVMEKLHTFGAMKKNDSTGLHVHMAKDAFTPSHLYRFLQFHRNLKEMCGLMGGRGHTNRWGKFSVLEDPHFTSEMKRTARMKYFPSQDRYSAINLLPETTIELRYAAGTTDPNEIKTYLQWIMSVYDFTKSVKAYQATGALKEPGNFLWWVYENEDTYPEVVDKFRNLYPVPTPMVTR